MSQREKEIEGKRGQESDCQLNRKAGRGGRGRFSFFQNFLFTGSVSRHGGALISRMEQVAGSRNHRLKTKAGESVLSEARQPVEVCIWHLAGKNRIRFKSEF